MFLPDIPKERQAIFALLNAEFKRQFNASFAKKIPQLRQDLANDGLSEKDIDKELARIRLEAEARAIIRTNKIFKDKLQEEKKRKFEEQVLPTNTDESSDKKKKLGK
jgi:hypothetical protein